MNTDATSLDRLHDILLAPPVPWWPPAPGWYWVLGLILVVLIAASIKGLIFWQHNRYRREALVELARQEAALGNPEQRPRALYCLAELLKRTAVTAYRREDVATLTGLKWFEFLDDTGKNMRFGNALGPMLENAVYDPRTADALDQQMLNELVQAIRHWIKTHDPRLEPKAGGPVEDPSLPAPTSAG